MRASPDPRRGLAVALMVATTVAGMTAPAATAAGRAPGLTVPATATTGTQVSGLLTQDGGAPLPGMAVQALPDGASGCVSGSGCVSTYSGAGGSYTLTGLPPGGYALQVIDGSSTVTAATIQIAAGQTSLSEPLTLAAPAVPAGTRAQGTARDLRWLNAERARDGVGAGVIENPRWSAECAAHDAYEATNGVLQPTENPLAPGASAGGAWAGRNAVLAQGTWNAAASPWENAPVHLLALLAPSLSVTGIDDTGAEQCVITFPGMVRAAPTVDTLTTVPAAGQRGVAPAELARETPFTPVQFAGLPANRPTGHEIFVYLNRAGVIGQSAVQITGATLRVGGRSLAVRTVDSDTRTIGPYLAGGIIIPVRPLAADTTYRATVAVADGTTTLTRSWSFTTR